MLDKAIHSDNIKLSSRVQALTLLRLGGLRKGEGGISMKTRSFLTAVIMVLWLVLPNSSFTLDLYEDFSGTSIDLTRWRWGEFIREIRDFGGDKKLLLARSHISPLAIGSYNNSQTNNLSFADPNSVSSIEATVTLLEGSVSGAGTARARLAGRWYNDGTPGGGFAGDIWAEINLWAAPGVLKGWWYVGKYTGESETTLTQLAAGDFTQPITMGVPYILYLGYDGVNKFTFRIGAEEITYNAPPRSGNPNNPWKALGVRTQINNASSSCYVGATFDNVYKNENLYDNFSLGTIDPSKWMDYEFVREISGGKLRSRSRNSATFTSPPNNTLEIAYPMGISTIEAKLTPLVFENPQGLFQVADLSGTFFNDGTEGSGFIGDVVGQVLIGGWGSEPVAMWRVYRYLDSAGNTIELLASGVFSIPITLGNTYLLSLSWSGKTFTFSFQGEIARYEPETAIHPTKHPFRRLRTLISPAPGKTEAEIEALFDDVRVGYVPPNDDFSQAFIHRGRWKNGEMVREIESGALVLACGSSSPIVTSSFPYTNFSQLGFADPNNVSSIRADVVLLDYELRNNAYTRARLDGRWYNDGSGTPGTDMTGDIWAEVSLREDPSGLYGQWAVYRFTDAAGTAATTLGSGNFATPITAGMPYTLFISYDSVANRFTFKIGSETYTFGPSGLPTRVRDPNSPWKGLTARTQINDDQSFGYVAAAFDNVQVNGTLYDDFSSPMLNPTKWTRYEFVRELSEGRFHSKVRSGPASTSNLNSSLESTYPVQIRSMRARVTPVLYQNDHGLEVIARIGGIFYHDDTPGASYTGDVAAGVRIGGFGTAPEARWQVQRYTDDTGQNWEVLAEGAFSTPIILGNTYTMFLGWDGSRFTFRFEGEEAQYTPTTAINPANVPTRQVGNRINHPAGNEALIEAYFDDVVVNSPTIQISPSSTLFGNVLVGATSEKTITISNPGDGWLEIKDPVGPNPPFEAIDSTTCPDPPLILDPGASCTVVFRFSPLSAGTFSETVTLETNDPDHPTVGIPLQGTGIAVLTVDKTGSGHGTITSSPPGIDCGSDCQEQYDTVTTVTLTATPNPDSNFTGWSGGGCSGVGTCTVTMSEHVTVTASFEIKTYGLDVVKAGSGSGTVTSGDGLISCGSDCSEIYAHGTSVTLTATPNTGSVFAGWSGGGCTGTGPCTVVMDGPKTITATFSHFLISPNEGTLGTEVTITGAGFGASKGKVLIGGLALKISEWTDTRIQGAISKVPTPGVASDVVVQPKVPKGAPPITEPGGFTARGPDITSVEPESGVSGSTSPITIHGKFFSKKKGKVTLERAGTVKNCKVLTWTMETITFLVPKKMTAASDYTLRVSNSVGSDTTTFGVTTTP